MDTEREGRGGNRGIRAHSLGEILVGLGSVRPSEVEEALRAQPGSGLRIGTILVQRGALAPSDLCRGLALQLDLGTAEEPLQPPPEALALLPHTFMRERKLVPLALGERTIRIAMVDPIDLSSIDDIQFRTGRTVEVLVASPEAVARALHDAGSGVHRELLDDLPDRLRRPEGPGDRRPGPAIAPRAAPVVRLVDHAVERAILSGASDIHVEESSGEVRIRYRIDGILRPAMELPPAVREAFLSRIKIMSGMDISVKLRPQDGGFALELEGRRLDVRASTLPVSGGEKAVLRILDSARTPVGLDALGLSPDDMDALRRVLTARQGVVLAAGPTGSGKSTSLFAALREIDASRENVVTLEDPIEYRVAGINQVQVAPKAGLSFPAALRSVLRQDPDVILIGEIRDRETAEIAMAAAITGHLVLSTIHTTDAPSGISRLLHMGVPPFLIAGGLSAVVAQRLVRRTCPSCQGAGCPHCSDGLKGRVGIFQLLRMTERLREAIVRGASAATLRQLAAESGMGTLAGDARRKVAEGLTRWHEVIPILKADPEPGPPCRRCSEPIPEGARGCPSCGAELRRRCRCGLELEAGWRFCPECLRRTPF